MSIFANKLKQPTSFASYHIKPRLYLSPSTLRLLTLGLLLTFQSCGLDVEDPTPPSPPVWVEKSFPEEWPERGIDAHETGGISLEWRENLGEDIVAYHIFRATYCVVNDSIGVFDHLTLLARGESTSNEYIDTSVEIDKRYYFKLKAEDVAGNFSGFSDSISYTAKRGIDQQSMTPNGVDFALPTNRVLVWHNYYLNETADYCLTILHEEGCLLTRNMLQPTNYLGGKEFWIIPDSLQLETGQKYKWRIDTGWDYFGGMERGGSESPWAVFLYLEES